MFNLTQLYHRFFLSPHTIPFDPSLSIIEIPVRLQNNDHELFTSFALDTGATYTVLDDSIAEYLDLHINPKKQVQLTTASGNEIATLVNIPNLSVAGYTLKDSPALITQLPEDAGITGLLGLSTLKQFHLTLDFKMGRIIVKKFRTNNWRIDIDSD